MPDFLLENVDMEMRPLVQDNFFSKAGKVFYRRNSLFFLLENINKDQAYGPSENKPCHRRKLKKNKKNEYCLIQPFLIMTTYLNSAILVILSINKRKMEI